MASKQDTLRGSKTNERRLTFDRASSLLEYNPKTGEVTRKVDVSNSKAGTVVGCVSNGYLVVRIDDVLFRVHRVAWLLFTGRWPKHQIDHINQDKTDNRISNLREVTHKENQRNRSMSKYNTTGVTGVSLHEPTGKFRAYITLNRVQIHLGLFASSEAAAEARRRAEMYYGFSSLHGRAKTI
jgi:hypothetical protein